MKRKEESCVQFLKWDQVYLWSSINPVETFWIFIEGEGFGTLIILFASPWNRLFRWAMGTKVTSNGTPRFCSPKPIDQSSHLCCSASTSMKVSFSQFPSSAQLVADFTPSTILNRHPFDRKGLPLTKGKKWYVSPITKGRDLGWGWFPPSSLLFGHQGEAY